MVAPQSTAVEPTSEGESSFGRGLRVLLLLTGGSRRTIPEMAEHLELPLSTVYRYIRELRRLRLVDEITPGTYAAGAALFGLALGAPLVDQLRLYAQPALERLVARTSETAMLSIRVDSGAKVIAQVESPEPMRLSFAAGTIRPLHAGATATVLLAFERPAAITRVLAGPLERFTPNTITDPARLEQRLSEIRAAGYAVSTGEADLDATAVAAPVFHAGRILCALSVTGPATRFGPPQIEAYAAVLLAETKALIQLLMAEAD